MSFLVVFIFVLCSATSVFATTEGISFDEWYEDFRRQAVTEGVRVQTLDNAFKKVELLDDVIKADRKQPEFRKSFQSYIDNAINGLRIKKAKKALQEHKTVLDDLYRQYGVSPKYLISFWAMETDFGRQKGTYSVFSSLATLAYDTRRPDFFRKELLNALFLAQKGMNVDKMNGSWAGAMGNFQFMPTTYLAYGRDYDGDGVIDLFGSVADAMASAANYLSSEGWVRGQDWGREVFLPKNFDWNLIDSKKTIAEWKKLGVVFADKNVNDDKNVQAMLVLPSGVEGPAFLAYPNFFVITRWNRSVLYAVSVGHLADRISGKGPFKKQMKKSSSTFSMEDAVEMQKILKTEKLYAGEIDGILGGKTREAIMAFQKMYELPPDGYADDDLLDFMRLVTDTQTDVNALSFDDIVAMQKILAKGQYYKGPFDGKLGKATKEGIELFKNVYNIRSSRINKKLLAKMRVHARRDMENGEIEPVVKEYQERKEKERREREKRKKQEKRNQKGKKIMAKNAIMKKN